MARWSNEHTFDAPLQLAAERYASEAGISVYRLEALAKAHIGQESSFNPGALNPEPGSPTGPSRGLMQITEQTARALGWVGSFGDDRTRTGGLYDPEEAIPLGVSLMAQNLQGAGGDEDVAIAAYNEGLARALSDRAKGGPFRNQGYVNAVKANLAYFLAEQASAAAPDSSGAGPVAASSASWPATVWASVLAAVAAAAVWWWRHRSAP